MVTLQHGKINALDETEEDITGCMLLYRDGDLYVVEVLAYPSCRATGTSYSEAIENAADIVRQGRRKSKKSKQDDRQAVTPPDVLRSLKRYITDQIHAPLKPTRENPVKALLVQKYGNLSNREIAARLGIFGNDSPATLSVVTGGRGSQELRCKIALVLKRTPSELWPLNPPHKKQKDDEAYSQLILNNE